MKRILFVLAVAGLVFGCGDNSQSDPPVPGSSVANKPLPLPVMRAMFAAGAPCVERFRSSMPPSYSVDVRVRSVAGLLAVEFKTAEHAAFNACIVDAFQAARIPVELTGTMEIPLVFDFTAK